jgi:glycosyltransferase involved in cell wall biosynthesis
MSINNSNQMADISQFVSELNQIITPTERSDPLPDSKELECQKKIKVLIVTTHINQVNGYSKVIYNIIKQLSSNPWISLVHYATQKMVSGSLGRNYPPSVKVIDASSTEKEKQGGFAMAELPSVILSEKPDIVFIYNDLAIIQGYIENIKKRIDVRSFKIWAYTDITYKAIPPAMIDMLNRDVERIFCFTSSWKECLKEHGITRPVDVMPHAVDPSIFHTIPREVARQSLGLPKDTFLFVSLNTNIPRKRLDLLIIAFVKLIVRFPTSTILMLIVADKGDRGGFQLFDIFANELKIHGASTNLFGNRLLITSNNTCYKDSDINMLYNCADVGVSCAEGEGFGLCAFEQMRIGIPQIVPEINGYTEYCTKDNSLLVKPKMRGYLPQIYGPITGQVDLIDTDDYSKAMEKYVFDEDLRKLHSKAASETVSKYTWDKCCSIMLKRLRSVQEDD